MSCFPISDLVIKKASVLKKSSRLSSGCSKLDTSLSGGFPVGGITEICGESGSGKSQLCMQLALMVQYPESIGGLNGGALYICSEEHFQSKRLYQMMDKFPYLDKESKNKIEFGNNIFVLHVSDYKCLENSFEKIFSLVEHKNIKLLVLDSITALFRGSETSHLGRQKAKDLRTIARNFYKLSWEHGVLVICVNQVSEGASAEKELVPALGLVWANLVTTRLLLKKNNLFRSLKVVFSPHIPGNEVQFKITESGVMGFVSE